MALGCGSAARAGDGATNLRIYPGFAGDLQRAFFRIHDVHEWKGPLSGYSCHSLIHDKHRFCGRYHVFYARYRGAEYAAATFWGRHTGATDQPEHFKRAVGGRWRDTGDGWPPQCAFPAPVVKVWGWPRCR